MIGGEFVAYTLANNGIDTVFGLVGNQISSILVNLKKYNIDFIGSRHEQGAIHMADGWSQQSRTCGVAMISGGPGFTNSINGIVKAYMANTPLLVITGSIVYEQKDKGNLQDMNQLAIIKDYTKWRAVVYNVDRISEYINKALMIAMTGKKGPVVLEIPISILRKEVNIGEEQLLLQSKCKTIENQVRYSADGYIKELVQQLKSYSKPIVLIGDEAYYAKTENVLKELVKLIKIPFFTINKARGLISDDMEYCFGNGRVLENGPQITALTDSDFILSIGVAWDYQMDCFSEPTFNEQQKIVYVTEKEELLCSKHNVEHIVVGVRHFLNEILEIIRNDQIVIEKNEWCRYLKKKDQEYWDKLEMKSNCNNKSVNPIRLIKQIEKLIDDDTIIVLDGSNAMFWAALFMKATCVGQIIIAPDGQHGSMGCGLPLAIGAKKAQPNKNVLLYTGDGSFGFNLSELDTSIRYNLPISIVVHNDNKWGLCETTQVILYENTCGTEISSVRYYDIIKAFGGYGYAIQKDDEIEKIITEKNAFQDKSVCFDVAVDMDSYSPGLEAFNETLKKMK